jgi:1-deoxy-D-xylulose-5-phosphate reductoisomerase
VGANALEEAAALPCDWLMAAIVGACGLRPTLAAIQTGATIALANKECLVCGGEWLMQQVQTHKATLLPVDSEHNAIFQVFDQKNCDLIEKITLTASGGPFRDYTLEAMQSITPEEAVVHPNWDMGAKISVDSATMMNKGLELIEAYHLFPCDLEQIDILVHPESIIHSMVHYKDGSVLAQMSHPDMRTPIAHTLAWPERIEIPHTHLDFSQIQSLTFEAYDDGRFPAPMLAREVAKKGGNLPIVLNAANEIAVDRFLKGEIDFLNIIAMIEHLLEHAQYTDITSLNDIMTVDAETREIAKHLEM